MTGNDVFHDLLAILHRGGQWHYTWTGIDKQSRWSPVDKPLLLPVERDVYFGVHPCVAIPRTNALGKSVSQNEVRSQTAYIAAVNCLFAEFDAKDFGGSKDTCMAHITDLPIAPSVIIDSGGGYHCYFLLDSPFVLTDDPARERIKSVQSGWVSYTGADTGSKDLARVLRVPGTLNCKYDPPRIVKFLRADLERVYGLTDLEALLPAPKNTNGNGRRPSTPTNGTGPKEKYVNAAVQSELDILARTREPGRNNQLNKSAFALGQFIGAGLLPQWPTEDALLQMAIDIGLGEHEATIAIRSGIAAGMKEPRQIKDKPVSRSAQNHEAQAEQPEETDAGAFEHLTDTGNAHRLVKMHGHNLRYCHPWEKWLIWDNRRWALDQTGEAERKAKRTIATIYAEAADADDTSRKLIGKHALRSESGNRIREMLRVAQSEPGIHVLPTDMDTDPWALNVLNGTLDLRSGRLHEHERQDMLTKLAPVFYLPDAGCPTWLAFLARIFAGDQDLISFMRRVVGYSLTGDVSEQVLFFLYGSGANGKSTFLNAILKVLGGDYAKQVAPDVLTLGRDRHPTELADLAGVRFASSVEVEDGKKLAEALVKQLTGGDPVKARRMREDFYQFDPTFKIFLAANHELGVNAGGDAIWRRIRKIPFTVTIPTAEQDRDLGRKLLAESSGILSWAMEGCIEWQRAGLMPPAAVTVATEKYRADSDILAQFLEECTTSNAGYRVAAHRLYAEYKRWAIAAGEREMTSNMLGRKLAERGIVSVKQNSRTSYPGIDLIDAENDEQ